MSLRKALRRKYFSESWLLWSAIAVGISIFCWVRVRVVGEFDTSQFRQIVDLLPKDWRKFSSVDFDWLVSYLGRTALTLDEPMLLMLISSWVIVRGSDVVSGELGRGTMEMLLAQPVSRMKVWWTHAWWTFVGMIGLVFITWLFMAVGIWTTSVEETSYMELNLGITQVPLTFAEPVTETIAMSSKVNPLLFLPGVVNLFSLCFFLGGFSAWCSSMDRFRWRTLGIVAAFYFLQGGMKVLAMASESLSWIRFVTVFGYYGPANSIEAAQRSFLNCFALFKVGTQGQLMPAPLLNNLLLLSLGALLYVWGSRIFKSRDLPAPI
jgi:ABC-2 type transport system permease protein